MRRFLFVFIALIGIAPSAQAQDTPGVFASYEVMRSQMDPLIEARDIGRVTQLFAEMSPAETQNLFAAEIQFRNALPFDLSHVELVRVQEFENGFRQELMSYHDGNLGYLFVRIFLHERDDGGVVALRFSANTNIDALLGFF